MADNENIKNLYGKDAIDKIRELVKKESICMFTTRLAEAPLSTRPMSTQEPDEDGNLWFFSSKSSHKNQHIEADPKIQLFYSNPGNYEFLSVYGTASINLDIDKIKDMWTPFLKAWFQEGTDDPEISLIKVIPEDAYYWDTKNNKMVSMIKILTSVVVGKTMDDGVEGKLEV
ncbi:MAG: pyridoxamine 5'-phosphate oxidase family protein [Chitinophagaceae bacterium]